MNPWNFVHLKFILILLIVKLGNGVEHNWFTTLVRQYLLNSEIAFHVDKNDVDLIFDELLSQPNLSTNLISLKPTKANLTDNQQSNVLHFSWISSLDGLRSILDEINSSAHDAQKWFIILNFPILTGDALRILLVEPLTTLQSVFPEIILCFFKTNSRPFLEACRIIYRIDTIVSPIVIRQIQLSSHDCYSTFSKYSGYFSGTLVNVVGIDDPFYSFNTKFAKGEDRFQSGYAVEVLHGMQDILNFTIKARRATALGYKDTNGSWVGMIDDIQAGRSDLAISNVIATQSRGEVADFNMPTYEIRGASAIFKRIQGYINFNAHLMPFSPTLWIAIWIWILVHFLFYKLHPFILKMKFGSVYSESHVAIPLSALCCQGSWKPSPVTTIRIMYFFELIVVVVLNSVYSAVLVSILAVENNPIKSPETLLLGNFRFQISKSPVSRDELGKSRDPSIRKIFQLGLKSDRTTEISENYAEIAQNLNAGGFAFLIDRLGGALLRHVHFTEEESCQIQDFQLNIGIYRYRTFVRKKSKIKRSIDYSLMKMIERGNTRIWYRRHVDFLPKCDGMANSKSKHIKPTSLSDVRLALQISSISFVLGLSILGLEIIWNKCRLSSQCSANQVGVHNIILQDFKNVKRKF